MIPSLPTHSVESARKLNNSLHLPRHLKIQNSKNHTMNWSASCLYHIESKFLAMIHPNQHCILQLLTSMPMIWLPRDTRCLWNLMHIMSVYFWNLPCHFCNAWGKSFLVSKSFSHIYKVCTSKLIQNQPHPFSDVHSEEGFGSFLDDFAVNVFLPQIEEKVMQLIQHATVGK